MHSRYWMRLGLAVAVGLLGLGVYGLTLAPGLTWANDGADGGELAAAAYTLGIAHPPGYPTYLLLAHPFTRLPVGEVATRTNLFSACCAAGAAALLAWSLSERSPLAAAAGGLALAFSPLLWSQAVITEVHALNALWVALVLGLALEAQKSGNRWAVGALGLVWGLSLGNHPSAVVCLPLLLWAIWPPGEPPRIDRLWRLAAGAGLGLLVYLYLPIRAAADPPVNWGDPRTPARFAWVISGALYHPFLFGLPLRFWPGRIGSLLGLAARQFGPLGIAGVVAGVWALARRGGLLAATGAVISLSALLAVGYDTTDSYLYLIPALVCLSFWLGRGIDWIGAFAVEKRRVWVWAIAGLFVVLPLAVAVYRLPQMRLGPDAQVAELGRAVLDAAPPDALIWSARDEHTFALWYFQHAQGERPDLIVVDVDLLAHAWYAESLARRWPGTVWGAALPDDGALAQSLARPVCRIRVEPLALTCVEP